MRTLMTGTARACAGGRAGGVRQLVLELVEQHASAAHELDRSAARERASRRSRSATRTSPRRTSSASSTPQALEAKGYKVTLKPNIGSSEIIYKALTSGQIADVPRVHGHDPLRRSRTTTSRRRAPATPTPRPRRSRRSSGFTLLDKTPFFDSDAIAVTKAYAAEAPPHDDRRPQDARRKRSRSAARPSSRRASPGCVGLKKVYGVNPTFKPLRDRARLQGDRQRPGRRGDVFTTDAQLTQRQVHRCSPTRSSSSASRTSRRSSSRASSPQEGPAFTDDAQQGQRAADAAGDPADEQGRGAR